MFGARGSNFRRSSALVVCSESASAGLTRSCSSRLNTRGSPTVENTRFLWPTLPTVPSSSMASSTLSRLCAGSPMPMNTTLRTGRRMRASATWAMISALPTCRSRPSRPVMQNWHPTAQPTCDETQRPSRGSSTLSTVWPSASATSSRSEPSAPGWTAWMRASPASSASMDGRASISDDGKKLAGRRLPLLRGSAWDHSRRIRCSWLGPAPASRSRRFSSWIRMQ